MRVVTSALVFVLALGWGSLATPQDPVRRALRFAFAPGATLRVDVETSTAMVAKGAPAAANMTNSRATRYELVIAEAAGEHRFKGTFGTLKDDVRMNGSVVGSSDEPLLQEVLVDARGQLLEVDGSDPERSGQTETPRKELQVGLFGGLAPLPDEPVGVGSTWTRQLEGGDGGGLPVPVILTNRVEAMGADGAVTIVQTAAVAPGASGPPATLEWRMTFVLEGGLLESSEGSAKLTATKGEKTMTVDHTGKRRRVS